MTDTVRNILRRIGEASPDAPLLSKDEARELMTLPLSRNMDILALAAAARAAYAPAFFNCGIINAKSGRCAEDCAFCAQSVHHNTGVAVYPLVGGDTLLRKAEEAAAAGAKRFGIVTSGTQLGEKDAESLCQSVKRIVSQIGIAICGSLGILDEKRAAQYRAAGISRYHHNLETAASYFPNICATHAYEEDIASLRAAKAAGMEVCSGGIIGLGENHEQRVELAFTLAELKVDSVPINFLQAIPGTKLANVPRLAPAEALRAIALFRLALPARDILIAGGRRHALGDMQSWLYAAGANGMMIGNYLTTTGSDYATDHAMMRALGIRQ